MLNKLKGLFKGKKSEPETLGVESSGQPVGEDLCVAVAGVLVEMAGADSDISPAEAEAVCSLLQQELGLPEEELPKLVQQAVGLRKSRGKIDEFVGVINERYNSLQRQRVLAMVWRLVMADGKVDKSEGRFAVQMKFRLKLSDDDAEAAKKLAEMF